MIFSENRYPLFGIMRSALTGGASKAQGAAAGRETFCGIKTAF